MKYLRLYTGADGETHFDEHEMSMGSVPGRNSPGHAWKSGSEAVFLSSKQDSGQALDVWHPAPDRQFIVTLAGETEIEASDGEIRRFGPGDILLVEDTTGKGHRTRYKGARQALHVPVVDPVE
jgi:hypothetical protein